MVGLSSRFLAVVIAAPVAAKGVSLIMHNFSGWQRDSMVSRRELFYSAPMPLNMDIHALLQAPRAGLRPLPVHVGAVLAAYAKDPISYPNLAGDLQAMIAGIQKYQTHSFRRSMSPLAEVWREGQARLFLCPSASSK